MLKRDNSEVKDKDVIIGLSQENIFDKADRSRQSQVNSYIFVAMIMNYWIYGTNQFK
jgi:hypothetical protein